jgi:hypothetical protein
MTVDAATAGPRRRARLLAVAATVASAIALWALIEQVFGLDLRGPESGGAADVGPAQVTFVSALAAFAGWGFLAILERVTSRARSVWTTVAVVVLVASFGGPVSGTVFSQANRIGLIGLHLVVGAVPIPLLRRSTPKRSAALSGQAANGRADQAGSWGEAA